MCNTNTGGEKSWSWTSWALKNIPLQQRITWNGFHTLCLAVYWVCLCVCLFLSAKAFMSLSKRLTHTQRNKVFAKLQHTLRTLFHHSALISAYEFDLYFPSWSTLRTVCIIHHACICSLFFILPFVALHVQPRLLRHRESHISRVRQVCVFTSFWSVLCHVFLPLG